MHILANYTGVQDENVDKVIKKIMIIANEDIYNYLVEEKKVAFETKKVILQRGGMIKNMSWKYRYVMDCIMRIAFQHRFPL